MATADAGTKRRAHVVLPSELLEEIDSLVGPRGRSQFIQEAVTERLARQRLRRSLREMEGSLAGYDIPGWETPETAAEWVRAMRRGEDPDVSTSEPSRHERAG